MNYELAKQLKDAGFPNADKRCSYCAEHNYESCTECEDRTIGLSELIEACGDKYKFITIENENGYAWKVYIDLEDNEESTCWGETP